MSIRYRGLLSLICGVIMLGLCSNMCGAIPTVKVPQASAEQVTEIEKMLAKKTTFNKEFWKKGAIVQHFTEVGGSYRMPVKTDVYLFHDKENLYVGAIMEENSPIRSAKRSWDEDFSADAALQIALGQGVQGQLQKSTIAGYDAAYSARQNIRHFYEFAVNSAGSMARLYNESNIETALFSSAVWTEKNEWQCVIKIPFRSTGIILSDNGVYYFNIFRFYNSTRYGWVLPSYGGYNALAFGRIEFLAPQDYSKRSQIPASTKPLKTISTPRYIAKPEITYYPLDKKVTVQFPPAGNACKIGLKIGNNVVEKDIKRGETGKLEIPVTLATGNTFEAIMLVGGSKIASQSFTVPEFPDWYQSTAGREYLEDKVAAPWKAIEFKNGVLSLAHSKWTFNDKILPSSIKVKDRELLSGSITVNGVTKTGMKAKASEHYSTKQSKATFLTLNAKEKPTLEVKTRVEFDGFSIIRIKNNSRQPVEWKNLQVRIPLNEEVAKFVHFGYTQQLLNIKGSYRGTPSEFWVGNGNIGLSFSFDRNCFRPTNSPRIVVENNEMIIQLADSKSGVFEPGFVWEFFLQPTPIRGDIVPPLADKISTGRFESWSNYQGYPDLGRLEEVKSDTAKFHAKGHLHYLYFSNLLAENSPGYDLYKTDLFALPSRMWYRRPSEPGKGVQCFVTCLRKHRGDQMLHGVRELLKQADIDGVYLDGPTVPFSCENPGHDCSDFNLASWNEYDGGRILGQRRFLQRLRGIFDAAGKPYPIYGHTGGGFNIATTGFADIYLDGEQMSRYRDGYLVEPDKFRITFTGASLGVRGRLLPILYFDSNFTSRRALPWALVHGTETVALKEWHPLEKFFFDFMKKKSDAKFYPYWENQEHLCVESNKKVYTSYQRTDNEGIVVISNLTHGAVAEVTLDLSKFFENENLQVYCLNTGNESFELDGKIVRCKINSGKMKYFYVTSNETLPANMPTPAQKIGNSHNVSNFATQTTLSADKWTVREGTFNSDGTITITANNGKQGVLLNKGFLPNEFTARFTVKHGKSFQILFDGIDVTYKEATGWLINGVSEFENEDYCATSHRYHRGGYVAKDVQFELIMTFKDGHLSINYDGNRLLQNALPAVKNGAHTIGFTTSNGSVELKLNELKAGGEEIFSQVELQHPILE